MASYLRACGYEVDTAEVGQAAIENLDLRKPDAVVMDMNMPRINGRECVERIRRNDRFDDVKFIWRSTLPIRLTKFWLHLFNGVSTSDGASAKESCI